jgi:hypothetical protein
MSRLTRRHVLTGGATAALAGLAALATPTLASAATDDTSATAEVVALVTAIFRDKTNRDLDRFTAHFSQHVLTYTDATIGAQFPDWPALRAAFAQLMPTWPATSRSYPTKILGDERSAMVFFTDSPELFGHEIRVIAPIDFANDKIIREVDYWDGRHFGVAATEAIRTPAAEFPTEFGEGRVGERSSATLRGVASALANALSIGDTAAAAALFTTDAAFADLTLHTTIIGRSAIRGFLDRSHALLPYGPGTSIRHTVGSARGGGYEWLNKGAQVDHGVVALELDDQARITRLTTVWDGSLVDNATLGTLLATTIEQ